MKTIQALQKEVEKLKGDLTIHKGISDGKSDVIKQLEERVKELEEVLQYLINCNQRERFKCEMPNAIFKAEQLLNK